MTKRPKKLAGCLLAAALGLLWAGGAWAAFPEPDTDSLTITITPSVDLGVDVDTGTTRFSVTDTPGTMSLSLPLGNTAYFVSPATVTILGNFNNQEVQVVAQALDNWAVDTDQDAKAEKAQLFALFAADKDAHPTEADFDSDAGRHQVLTGAQYAGEPDGSESNLRVNNRYEIDDGSMAGGGGAEMDNLAVGTVRQLWMRIDAPPFSAWSGPERFVVTLTAMSGVGN